MVLTKLMASPTSRNSDLKRKQLSPCTSIDFLGLDRTSGSGNDALASDSLTTDDEFLRSGSAEQQFTSDKDHRLLVGSGSVAPISRRDSEPPRIIKKTADDVWREIIAGKKIDEKQPKEEMMTLEDFLLKARAVEEEEEDAAGPSWVEVKKEGSNEGIYSNEDFEVGGFGRGKRSMSLLEPLDKAAEQRQRRMIKNRESAARSRERKQAYQVELESMAVRLEQENDRLSKEKEERNKKRLKQLMENVIPVAEKRRPPRFLRKIRSM